MRGAPSRSAPVHGRGLADLVDTLDAMVDQPLVSVALFGDAPPAIGRYAIERRLGAGATAVVYAARDTALDRPVALKIVAGRDLSGAWRARALEEARALARLSHPNVVAVHDVGEWQGHPFIAMELIEGATLAAWQVERRPWPEILRRYLAAGRGLEAAHSIGLIHRDFKPANVLVSAAGRVVVSDFGLAEFVAPAPREMAAGSRPGAGTPAYVAPEQRTGAAPNPAADIYSFAIALCEAITGRHPVLAPALDWRLELQRAGVPRRAAAAVARGMAPEPDQRGPAMGPLLAALEAALPRARRRRQRRVGAALGAATLVAGAILVTHAVHRPELRTAAVAERSLPGPAPGRSVPYASIARGLVEPSSTAAAALLREVPAPQRDADWRAAARAVLMRPIARELRCLEHTPPRGKPSIAHGLLVAIDARGQAIVCELARERATSLADAAICARALDDETVAVLAATGALTVFTRAAGWQPRRRIALGGAAPLSAARCDQDLAILGPRTYAVRGDAATWRILDLADPANDDLIELADPAARPFARSADRQRLLVRSARGDLVVALASRPFTAAGEVLAPAYLLGHDVQRVALTVTDDELTLIDLQRGAVIRRARIPLGALPTALDIAPDGSVAAVATGRGTLAWWALSGAGAAPRIEFTGATQLEQIAFNRAGSRLVWRGVLGALGVQDTGAASGHELVTGDGSICSVGFATDDRVVAARCDGRTLAWELSEQRAALAGRHDLTRCNPTCDEDRRAIWFSAVSDDGSVIATAGGDGTVGIWPLRRGPSAPVARRLPLDPAQRAFSATFFGDLLIVGPRDGAAQVWDWRASARVGALPGHETWVYAAAVARPSGELATLITGAKSGRLRFWSAGSWRRRAETLLTGVANTRINDLAVSPSGKRVAAALEEGEVAICDVATGARLARVTAHRGWVRRVRFLDEDTVLSAADDGLVQRIDVATGQIIASLRAHDSQITDLDRHGARLLTAAIDGTIRLWDLRGDSLLRTYVGHGRFASTVRWHPDGTRFVSGGGDGRVCVWRVDQETCHTWLIGHRGEVRSAQFIDGDRVVTTAIDGTVRTWTPPPPDATTEALAAELERRAPACLDAQQRMAHLGEPAEEAAARARDCRDWGR